MSRVLQGKDNVITNKYNSKTHKGIDLVGKGYTITNIIAHSNGEVVSLRTSYNKTDKTGNSYGNYILINHDNGYYTLYAHLKYGSIKVKKGTKVLKGEVIGRMGATGRATGVHLHFEVRNSKNERINPTPYINDNLPTDVTIPTDTNNNKVKEIKYKVKSGDNLTKIAKKYKTSLNKIYNDNKKLIDNENKKRGIAISKKWLYPNQVLVIKL